ncbi:MAG: hypothetical protein P4L46_17570 [Fimbriimonas sp.]|nr:hypothetical protein [Fimbriimonas sp.]
MNPNLLKTAAQYAAAFLSGYVGASLPVLAAGESPSQKALVAALVPALLATGLFHVPGPSAKP